MELEFGRVGNSVRKGPAAAMVWVVVLMGPHGRRGDEGENSRDREWYKGNGKSCIRWKW